MRAGRRSTMIDTAITIEAARAIGRIADAHKDADACIRILWRDVDAEQTWVVQVERPGGGYEALYVVDDETGTHCPLNDAERARFRDGLPLFENDEAST